MAEDHRVGAGECIGSIAHAHALPWQKIWNHPKNAELKKKRRDPNVLKEGDVVHVPDPEKKVVTVPTGAAHRLVVRRRAIKLRLRIVVDPGPKPQTAPPPAPSSDRKNEIGEDPEPSRGARADEARGGVRYKVEIGGATLEGETDADGFIDCEIPPAATSGRLILAPGTPHETELPLNFGHLDPIEDISGVKQRLTHLCFDCGDQDDEETPELESALRAFQEKHGLSATGKIDAATRDELARAHGG